MANTNGHYKATEQAGRITNLYCLHCNFIVWRPHFRVGNSKYGQAMAKYGKMRAEMVKHLHECHRELL